MTTERLSGLALMSIHYEKPVDYDAVAQRFAEQTRRMLLLDPIFEQTQTCFFRAHSQYNVISILFSRLVSIIVNV